MLQYRSIKTPSPELVQYRETAPDQAQDITDCLPPTPLMDRSNLDQPPCEPSPYVEPTLPPTVPPPQEFTTSTTSSNATTCSTRVSSTDFAKEFTSTKAETSTIPADEGKDPRYFERVDDDLLSSTRSVTEGEGACMMTSSLRHPPSCVRADQLIYGSSFTETGRVL